MRESSKTEKMHLGDAYEEWLKRQRTQPEKTERPRKPEADLYETWVEKLVEKRVRVSSRAKLAKG